ncbi:type II toxin-antitoxin system MqsA family antitoxin [Pseudomonas sp. App30]|uniref:type II toxin-antitoxin system MqsA family antitoxin n=1 Tax=Pseudomonas sp. App30 TaxID=3068990 RepID=UPI003A8056B8
MTTHAEMCPVCGEGNLCERESLEIVEYKGRSGEVKMVFSECTICGSDQASAAQSRINKRSVTAFKKRADGLLTGREIANLRAAMNLTQARAADVFGGGPVAFSKYENDDITQSESMDTLIRLAASVPSAREWLLSRPDLDHPFISIFKPKTFDVIPKHAQPITQAHAYGIFASETAIDANAPRAHIIRDFTIEIHTTDDIICQDYYMTEANIESYPEKNIASTPSKPPRVYGEEENSKHYLSREYSEAAYDQHSI